MFTKRCLPNFWVFLVLLMLGMGPLARADAPLMGVQLKYLTAKPVDMEALKHSGFQLVRLGVRRELIEQPDGTLYWTRLDNMMAKAASLKLHVLLTVIDADASRRASFPAFMSKVVRRYGANPHVMWEIWNEPDVPQFWPGAPDANGFATLVKGVCHALRFDPPQGPLYGGGLSSDALEKPESRQYITALAPFVRQGCLAGVTVHPYREGAPETALADMAALRNTNPGVPFAISEWGYAATPQGDRTAETTRTLLAARALRVPFLVWYEWQNRGTNLREKEDSFGLLTLARHPTARLQGAQLALKWSGSDVETCVPGLPEGVFCLKRRGQGGQASAFLLWALSARKVVWQYPLTGHSLRRGVPEGGITPGHLIDIGPNPLEVVVETPEKT